MILFGLSSTVAFPLSKEGWRQVSWLGWCHDWLPKHLKVFFIVCFCLLIGVNTGHGLQICVETMMHLTCTNMPVEKLEDALDNVKANGIQNILALRGDPPHGQENFVTVEGGFSCALDLVSGKHSCKAYCLYWGIWQYIVVGVELKRRNRPCFKVFDVFLGTYQFLRLTLEFCCDRWSTSNPSMETTLESPLLVILVTTSVANDFLPCQPGKSLLQDSLRVICVLKSTIFLINGDVLERCSDY